MTDTARNDSPHKNGAATNGSHRGLAPNGIAPSDLGVSDIAGKDIAGKGSVRNGSAANADERSRSEPESGVHQTVMLPPRSAVAPLVAVAPAGTAPVFGADVAGVAAPALGELILLSVTETQVPTGWVSPEEELSCHELTVIVRGSQGTTREDGDASSGPVEAMLLKAGVRRQERNAGEVDLHRLRIGFHWRGAPAELPEMVQDTCGRLHEIASWLVAERDAQFPNVSDYRQGLLRALVGEYLRLSVVAASRIEEKTRTYMLRHLGEPITLEDLATNIGMSRYYFCRVYKEVAGHTPMEHLRALRLERAKDLIRSTALPLKAIAPEVGFGSAQHLCRLLHDRFGVGVRELRGAGTLESRGVLSDRSRDSDDAA
jgi:AraC-like DNA-binding protein